MDWRQRRRFEAMRLKELGWHRWNIAKALDVLEVSVSHWFARSRYGGSQALLDHPSPGHPAALSPTQRSLIPDFLSHGPEAYGFRGAVWTCARVAKVIEREFGVTYARKKVTVYRPPRFYQARDF